MSERRRRISKQEKRRIVEETLRPGSSVSIVIGTVDEDVCARDGVQQEAQVFLLRKRRAYTVSRQNAKQHRTGPRTGIEGV